MTSYSRWRAAFMVLVGAVLGTIGVFSFFVVGVVRQQPETVVPRWLELAELCRAAVEQHRLPDVRQLGPGRASTGRLGPEETWVDAASGLAMTLSEQEDTSSILLACRISAEGDRPMSEAMLSRLYLGFSRQMRDLALQGVYVSSPRSLSGGWLMVSFDSARTNVAGCTARALLILENPDVARATLTYFEVPPEFTDTPDCHGAALLG